MVNANWQERPTVRATGRGNSPPQHPGWPAYVWIDIFGHCAGFRRLYLCLTASIDMAKFDCPSICASAMAPLTVRLNHRRDRNLLPCSAANTPNNLSPRREGFSLSPACFSEPCGSCLSLYKSHSHPMVRACAPRHPESLMMRILLCGKAWSCVSRSVVSAPINSGSAACEVK